MLELSKSNELFIANTEFNDKAKAIDESQVILFFVTNEYLSSKEFQNELTIAKSQLKQILTISIEPISANHEELLKVAINLNCTDYHKYTNWLKTFLILLLNSNRFNSNEKQDDFNMRLVSIKQIENERFKILLRPKVNFISTSEIIIMSDESLKIYNIDSEKEIGEIKNKNLKSYYYIEHLEQLCIVALEPEQKLKLYEKNGTFVRDIIIPVENILSCQINGYSRSQKITFVSIRNQSGTKTIKFSPDFQFESYLKAPLDEFYLVIFNDNIFEARDKMLFFRDLSYNLINSLELHASTGLLFTDFRHPELLFIRCNKDVCIIDIKNICIFQIITHPFDLTLTFDEKIVFYTQNSTSVYLYFYKYWIKSKNSIQSLNNKYFCCISPEHLYKDPLVFDCGHYACLECIFKHINIQTCVIKCPLCHQVQTIFPKLEPDKSLIDMMTNNFEEIFKNLTEENKSINKSKIRGIIYFKLSSCCAHYIKLYIL